MKKNLKKLSIFNSLFSNHEGFTLIELLTVIGIMGTLGTIVVLILSVTLRGTRKSDLLETARQNGDVALSQMIRSIRYAQSLDNPITCVPTASVSAITVTSFSDKGQTTYACVNGANSTISSNSASLFDTTSLNVSSCYFTCSQPTTIDPPTITIQFTLSPKTTGIFSETNFTLPFQSSVTMRNFLQD